MKIATRTGQVTFEEFCATIHEDQKADLIDGVIYMAPPENTDANELFFWLGGLLDLYVEEKDLGKVYGSRVALRLDDHNGPEPDLMFVRKQRLHLVKRGHIAGPPDLAAELVSPDSIERDYEKKRRLYEEAGIPEYWIVDEIEEKVTVLRLDAHGKYREVRPKKGILRSQEVDGFWLRTERLWQNPRPRKLDVLKQLLPVDD